MKHKILKHLTKYILPVLALAIAVPVATAFLGSEGKTRVLADTPALKLGENRVTFLPNDQEVPYTFTPTVTGYYTFWSEAGDDYDPGISLYLNGSLIAENDDWSEDWDADYNFRLSVRLAAGETYTIKFVRFDDQEENADIVVGVKQGLDCTSGTCGAAATWTFDEDTDVLTISGKGDMANYYGDDAPWVFLTQVIKKVEIGDGITYIGEFAFEGCKNITSLTIGSAVTRIGQQAFYECTSLKEVVIPGNVKIINAYAFASCGSINSLTIEEGVISIGDDAFEDCAGLTEVVIPRSVTLIGSDAFCGCESVSDVYCYADPTPLTWNELGCDDFAGDEGDKVTKCHVYLDDLKTYKEKFDEEVNVEFVGDLPYDIDLVLGGTLQGYSLSLEGDIGVKFYMDLTGVDLSTNPYMEFTVPSGSKTEMQTVTLDPDETATVGEKTYYTFKCKVSAKDASSTIQAQLVAGENKSEIYSFSVKSYAEYIIACKDLNEQYGKSAPLAKALLTYCTCAQQYFGVSPANQEAPGEENYIDTEALNTLTADSMAIPAVVIDINSSSGVTFVGATLSLKSETTLSLYFQSDIELSFACSDHMTVEKTKVGGYQVARIRGIKAADLGKLYTLTIVEDTEDIIAMYVGKVSYSVLNYCYNVVNGGDTYDDDLQNVAKSLYLYYEAAKAYATSATE